MKIPMWSGLLLTIALTLTASHLAAGARQAPKAEPRAEARAIAIDNFKFSPETLEIPAGTKVTWTNRDDVPHLVASVTKKLFVSTVLDTDDSYSFTFTDAGTYEYYCSVHPHMTGKIVVK